MGKRRDKHRRVVGLKCYVVYGNPSGVTERFAHGPVHIERTHLTMRHHNSRLVRKTLTFSKKLDMHRAVFALGDLVYNMVKPLKTLPKEVNGDTKRKWLPPTPAMAVGLCNHFWSFKELFNCIPIQIHQL